MQVQAQLNLQLLKDQTHYSNVFVRCYEAFHGYIQRKNQKTLQSFLEQLECLTAIVKRWNNEYPGKEAQIKVGYNKEAIRDEIKFYLNDAKIRNNKEIEEYFKKYLNLVEQKNQNLMGSENIYKNVQKKQLNPQEINNIGYQIQKGHQEVEQYVENQKKHDFPDFNNIYNNNYYSYDEFH